MGPGALPVGKRELAVDAFVRSAIHLGVGVHEEVQGWPLLGRCQGQMPATAELQPVLVVVPEEVISLRRVLRRLAAIDGNPAPPVRGDLGSSPDRSTGRFGTGEVARTRRSAGKRNTSRQCRGSAASAGRFSSVPPLWSRATRTGDSCGLGPAGPIRGFGPWRWRRSGRTRSRSLTRSRRPPIIRPGAGRGQGRAGWR